MLIRNTIAVLDYNHNVERKSKIDKDGKTLFKMKVDRALKNVTVVEQKKQKDFSFQQNILDLCLNCLEKEEVPKPTVCFCIYFILIALLCCSIPLTRKQ